MTLVVDKVNGRGLSNTTHRERLPKKTGTSYSRITRRHQLVGACRSISIIKVRGRVRSDTFKIGLGFRFTVIIST